MLADVLAWLAVALFAAEFAIALLARAFRRRARADATLPHGFAPRCAIVMPTKGAPPELEANLAAHLRLDYPDFRLICAVEAEDDPGVPIIRRLAARDPRLQLVVAGLTTRGSQQNHNMIAGAAAAADADVLAFADNDYAPAPDWLRRLLRPLTDPAVAVSTGYRWLVSPERGGGLSHVAINATMYVHFVAMNVLLRRGLWGGAFALRRADFVAFGVADCWRDAISDDLTLTAELVRRRRPSVLAADLLIPTEDVLPLRGAARWYARQLLNVKAYDFPTWAGAIGPAYVAAGFVLVWPALAGGLALTLGGTFASWGGWVGVGYWVGEMVTLAVASGCGPLRNRVTLVALAPLWRAVQVWSWLASVPLRAIDWAGVRYRFDRRGRVVAIERLAAKTSA